MQLLKQYFEIQKQIYDYFDYKENWVVMPIDDATNMCWILNEIEGYVRYAKTKDDLYSDSDYYQNDIYTQRFLTKWVYPGKDYTMICVDTHADSNKFLQIFDNEKQLS